MFGSELVYILVLSVTLPLLPISTLPIYAWTQPLFNIKKRYDYDFVVIGAGASGMFAAGTASSLGFKTLLIEKAHSNDNSTVEFSLGGDCTNSACVPSKSLRSIAKIASTSDGNDFNSTWLRLAREQAYYAVNRVREREDPARIVDSPNLNLEFVKDCHFTSSHQMKLKCYDNSTWLKGVANSTNNMLDTHERVISGKKFLIATGAAPNIPKNLARAAANARVSQLTYRTLLRPNTNPSLLSESYNNIVIVGGGASACELGQSICRLGMNKMNVSIVAPTLLRSEDVTLQNAAINILSNDGCNLHLGSRVENVTRDDAGARVILEDNTSIPVDCILFCTGRSPEASLQSLQVTEAAGVHWTSDRGVTTNPYLQSTTAKHIYACGDCASAVDPRDRRAIHAGWLGFSAARNALMPAFLRSIAIHSFVPRVTYMDPEIASVGLTTAECIERYGIDGYDSLLAPEDGSDRADMDSKERNTDSNFIEFRSEKISGRILGVSACGPSASEVCNEVCLALVNKLTVRDIARTLHSYPSQGYQLYRIAMAMATRKISGLLAGCGCFGRFLGLQIRVLARIAAIFKLGWLPWRRRAMKKLSRWHAIGARSVIVFRDEHEKLSVLSFLDVYNNKTRNDQIVYDSNRTFTSGQNEYVGWVADT